MADSEGRKRPPGRPPRAVRKINLPLDVDAAELLEQLAGPHKRGQYVSELIRRAAVQAGIIEPGTGAPALPLDLTVLQRQLADLQERVRVALETQETASKGGGDTED